MKWNEDYNKKFAKILFMNSFEGIIFFFLIHYFDKDLLNINNIIE